MFLILLNLAVDMLTLRRRPLNPARTGVVGCLALLEKECRDCDQQADKNTRAAEVLPHVRWLVADPLIPGHRRIRAPHSRGRTFAPA
jgi:hypothetical protein